jgi:hypothetical protein
MKVSEFEKIGIRLSVTQEGALKYSAPKFLKKEFLEQLRENKTALVEELMKKEAAIRGEVTDVTDSEKNVTGVTDRNHKISDGSDGCDGLKKFPKGKKHTHSDAVYISPKGKEEITRHTRHNHHSGNENNYLTRHPTGNDLSGSVTSKHQAREIDPNLNTELESEVSNEQHLANCSEAAPVGKSKCLESDAPTSPSWQNMGSSEFKMFSNCLGREVDVKLPTEKDQQLYIDGTAYSDGSSVRRMDVGGI